MGGGWSLAALAGAAADLAGLGLIAAAAWLITRAAEQPPLAALSVAIVAARAFATSRGVFRYAERLTGHDVALRAQADSRERLYAALIPAGSRRHRRRGPAEPDGRRHRGRAGPAGALPASGGGRASGRAGGGRGRAVRCCRWRRWCWPAGLLVAGVLLPASAAAAARRWSARIAPAPGPSWPPGSPTWCTAPPTWPRTAPSDRALAADGRADDRLAGAGTPARLARTPRPWRAGHWSPGPDGGGDRADRPERGRRTRSPPRCSR